MYREILGDGGVPGILRRRAGACVRRRGRHGVGGGGRRCGV